MGCGLLACAWLLNGCPQLRDDELEIVREGDGTAARTAAAGAAGQEPGSGGGAGAEGDGAPPAGGAGEQTGGTAGGDPTSGSAGAAGASAQACGAVNVPEPAAACPSACDRCVAGACIVDCHGQDVCKDLVLGCPSGWACRVECVGKAACTKLKLACPPSFDCALSCSGDDACKDASLGCEGNCRTECTAGATACEGLLVKCGGGHCGVTCAIGSKAPRMECAQACGCVRCP